MADYIAGRAYPRAYRTIGKSDIADLLQQAVIASGARVVSASGSQQAPIYLTAETPAGERLGLLVYPFRMTTVATKNRPADEARIQIRYGAEASWAQDHPLGWDPAKVDVTMVLGCHIEMGLLVGLDPATYDPLPMGISVELKVGQLETAARTGWVVLTRENLPGNRRSRARTETGQETLVIFRPERLLDYARLNRRAAELGLDPPLRYAAAVALATPAGGDTTPGGGDTTPGGVTTLHRLEQQFGLSGKEILDIITERNRLEVAVRGGVAERHLEAFLRADPEVRAVQRLDLDKMHDFDIELQDGRRLRLECKNASPDRYADGSERVEVQKTRASKSDPASRFYAADQFDVVAACLFATRGQWSFRFQSTSKLDRHPLFPDRLATNHRVDSSWSDSPAGCVTASADFGTGFER